MNPNPISQTPDFLDAASGMQAIREIESMKNHRAQAFREQVLAAAVFCAALAVLTVSALILFYRAF